jgi:hypothetical protein
MQLAALAGDRLVDHQNAITEGGEQLAIKPEAKTRALSGISPLHPGRADLELHERNHRNEGLAGTGLPIPGHHSGVGSA